MVDKHCMRLSLTFPSSVCGWLTRWFSSTWFLSNPKYCKPLPTIVSHHYGYFTSKEEGNVIKHHDLPWNLSVRDMFLTTFAAVMMSNDEAIKALIGSIGFTQEKILWWNIVMDIWSLGNSVLWWQKELMWKHQSTLSSVSIWQETCAKLNPFNHLKTSS